MSPMDYVNFSGAHRRALALGDDLDALGGGIRALVELAGEVFDREDAAAVRVLEVVRNVVELGFREDAALALLK